MHKKENKMSLTSYFILHHPNTFVVLITEKDYFTDFNEHKYFETNCMMNIINNFIVTTAQILINCRPVSATIMVAFLFTLCLLMLNILIAQVSDTYKNVKKDVNREFEVIRASIVARIELNSIFTKKVSRQLKNIKYISKRFFIAVHMF